jgi:hypothetical protein
MNTPLRSIAVVGLAMLGLAIGGCKKSDSSTGPGGGGDTGGGGATLGQVLFTVDGTAYTGAGAAVDDTSAHTLVVAGQATVSGQNVTCGIYSTIENLATGTAISLNSGQPVQGVLLYGPATNPTSAYTTAVPTGTGTLTVLTKTATTITGTFSFTALGAPPTAGQKVVTSGSFNLTIVTQ